MLSAVACQEKGLLDWCIGDVSWWSCGRFVRANRLVTAGGDFLSVISIQLTVPTDCYIGERCSCGSVELTRVRIWFVAANGG